jgi:hypothetical protein
MCMAGSVWSAVRAQSTAVVCAYAHDSPAVWWTCEATHGNPDYCLQTKGQAVTVAAAAAAVPCGCSRWSFGLQHTAVATYLAGRTGLCCWQATHIRALSSTLKHSLLAAVPSAGVPHAEWWAIARIKHIRVPTIGLLLACVPRGHRTQHRCRRAAGSIMGLHACAIHHPYGCTSPIWVSWWLHVGCTSRGWTGS